MTPDPISPASAPRDPAGNVIGIDAFESPNVSDEPVPDSPAPAARLPDLGRRTGGGVGTDSPLFIAKVRGEFPDSATEAVIPRRLDPPLPARPDRGVDRAGLGDTAPRSSSGLTSAREAIGRSSTARRGATCGRSSGAARLPIPMLVVGRTLEAIAAEGATRGQGGTSSGSAGGRRPSCRTPLSRGVARRRDPACQRRRVASDPTRFHASATNCGGMSAGS